MFYLLAQTSSQVTQDSHTAFWVAIIAAIASAISVIIAAASPILVAWITASTNRKLTAISQGQDEQTKKIDEVKKETKQQTEKIDQAAVERKVIAADLKKKDLSESQPNSS